MNIFCHFFPISECKCNSQGSTKNDGSPCFGKCCNDDNTCKCRIGYIGSDCNECDNGYYVSNITNGEKTCSGTVTKTSHTSWWMSQTKMSTFIVVKSGKLVIDITQLMPDEIFLLKLVNLEPRA